MMSRSSQIVVVFVVCVLACVSMVCCSTCEAVQDPPSITQIGWVCDLTNNKTKWGKVNNKDGYDEDKIHDYAGVYNGFHPRIASVDFDKNELHVIDAYYLPQQIDGKQAKALFWDTFDLNSGKAKEIRSDWRFVHYIPRYTFFRQGSVWGVFFLSTSNVQSSSFILVAKLDKDNFWSPDGALVFQDEHRCTTLTAADYSVANDALYLSTCPGDAIKVIEVANAQYYTISLTSSCTGGDTPTIIAMQYDPLCAFLYSLITCKSTVGTIKYKLMQYNPATVKPEEILSGEPPEAVSSVSGSILFNRTMIVWYKQNLDKVVGYANLDGVVKSQSTTVDFDFLGSFGYHFDSKAETKYTVSAGMRYTANVTFPRGEFPPPTWPTAETWDDYESPGSSGLSAGDIVLIVVGVLGGLLLLGVVAGGVGFVIYKRRQQTDYDTI